MISVAMPVWQGHDRTDIISQITRSACEKLQKKQKLKQKHHTLFSWIACSSQKRRLMRLTKGAAENTKPVTRNPGLKIKEKKKTAAGQITKQEQKMRKQWQKNVNTVAKEI